MNYKNKARIMVLSVFMGFLGACASPATQSDLAYYEGAQPALSLDEYFNGPIKAWGLVQDRDGKVTRRFDVDMIGTWDGNVGTLEEDFEYYDGKTERRVWTITKLENNSYEGQAVDIIGVADGTAAGNTLRWAYQMDLSVDGKTFRMTFDDWMYLMNDGVLINRSYIKKFGITFAELTIFMQKQ